MLFFWEFLSRMSEFSNAISSSIDMIMWFPFTINFLLLLLILMYYTWLSNIELAWHCYNKLQLALMYYYYIYMQYWSLFSNILLRISASVLMRVTGNFFVLFIQRIYCTPLTIEQWRGEGPDPLHSWKATSNFWLPQNFTSNLLLAGSLLITWTVNYHIFCMLYVLYSQNKIS